MGGGFFSTVHPSAKILNYGVKSGRLSTYALSTHKDSVWGGWLYRKVLLLLLQTQIYVGESSLAPPTPHPKKKKNQHIKKGIFQKAVKILNTAANLWVVKNSVEQHGGGEEWADLGQIYDI